MSNHCMTAAGEFAALQALLCEVGSDQVGRISGLIRTWQRFYRHSYVESMEAF